MKVNSQNIEWYPTQARQWWNIPERISLHNAWPWPGDKLWRHLVILWRQIVMSPGSRWVTSDNADNYILHRPGMEISRTEWLTFRLHSDARRQEIWRWFGVRSIHLGDRNPIFYVNNIIRVIREQLIFSFVLVTRCDWHHFGHVVIMYWHVTRVWRHVSRANCYQHAPACVRIQGRVKSQLSAHQGCAHL